MIVLMYHGIVAKDSKVPALREEGAQLYDVSVEDFEQQIRWLKEKGLKPDITFDDGELNNFTNAFPILSKYGLSAYFFVIVKRVGKPGYMTWDQLALMSRSGMRIGSHGLTHEILTSLAESQSEEELRASKKTIEANLDIPVEDLSIPRGFCNDKIIDMAYRQGYKKVFISEKPYHVKSQCIPRVAVKTGWTLKRFEMAVHGKTPVREILAGWAIKGAKTILREPGYNWVRKMIIQ